MSSFTSKTVRDLYEAYNSVYIDETELFLNDVLDTVTESVNELVNEGYDLSDYSWDEIYESFLENVLEPELQEVESFLTELNESAEELTEEQIENLLENPLLRGLSFFSRGPKVTGSGGVTIPRPQPTPGTGRPLRNPRQLELPVGQDKGSFARFGDWLSGLTAKGRAQQTPTPPTPPKPPATPPASRQPSGTPQRQQGWPSIGLRDKVSRVTQALTPGPRVTGVTKGLLKYGAAPLAAAVGGVTGLIGTGVDVNRFRQGKSSVIQRLGGAAVGGLGDLAKTGANIAAATPGIKDTGTPGEVQQVGQQLKKWGSDIQKDVDVKRAKELRAQPSSPTQKPKKLFPEGLSIENVISEGPDWKSAPKPKGIAVLTLGKERKVYIPGQGWQFPATARRWARAQGYTDWDKIPNPAQPAKPKQDPVAPPAKPKQDPVAPPAKPKQDPVAPPPVKPAPAPTPFGKSVSAPAAADLDKYKINKDWAAANPRLAQAQVARASGQPRADINKILYKPGTAAYGASGKSEMEKQVDQMRQDREKMAKQREADKIGPQAQSALPGGAYSPAATANMTQRTRNILGVKEQYDAYDLVLEYLFSQGHVDTVDEAHYVMMQMDGDHIQNIVEVSGEWFRGIFNPNNSAASKVQKTSPFNRPVTPLPSITSPFSKPASRDDSGKLTPYGAGGGTAAEKGGKSRAEVMKQGATNLEKQNKPKANPGPDFGR